MTAWRIRPYAPGDETAIVGLIVPIQADEFGIAITAADQPDLMDIPGFYLPGAGGFWVAEAASEIVGTISLKDIGAGQSALRKMFVAPAWRGAAGVGAALLETLLAHARAKGLAEIILGTTDKFLAAHRFYEKNGFEAIVVDALPPAFPRMVQDTRFYRLKL